MGSRLSTGSLASVAMVAMVALICVTSMSQAPISHEAAM